MTYVLDRIWEIAIFVLLAVLLFLTVSLLFHKAPENNKLYLYPGIDFTSVDKLNTFLSNRTGPHADLIIELSSMHTDTKDLKELIYLIDNYVDGNITMVLHSDATSNAAELLLHADKVVADPNVKIVINGKMLTGADVTSDSNKYSCKYMKDNGYELKGVKCLQWHMQHVKKPLVGE